MLWCVSGAVQGEADINTSHSQTQTACQTDVSSVLQVYTRGQP